MLFNQMAKTSVETASMSTPNWIRNHSLQDKMQPIQFHDELFHCNQDFFFWLFDPSWRWSFSIIQFQLQTRNPSNLHFRFGDSISWIGFRGNPQIELHRRSSQTRTVHEYLVLGVVKKTKLGSSSTSIQRIVEVISCIFWQKKFSVKSQNRFEKYSFKTFRDSHLVWIQQRCCYHSIWNEKYTKNE